MTEVLSVPVPDFDAASTVSDTLTQHTVTEFFADLVITFRAEGRPVMSVIVEVQQDPKDGKRWSWPVYLATVRKRERCPAALLVVCPSRTVAAWAAQPIDCGPGWGVTPLAVAPDMVPPITDPARAARTPELAVLSALGHADDPGREQIFHAMLKGIDTLEPEQAALYFDYLMQKLSAAARQELEALVLTKPYEYKSDFARRMEARGEARGLLMVLEVRGVEVTDAARQRITGCTDPEQLDRWMRRALTVTSVEEVFAEDSPA
ncbi:hypothetical protein [Thermomonospora cellulosilytica]|uniref:hypothetical protein n=1 Tax=Thermomonospora cellulosilytica TaxID=1411118 RepID=UPI001C71A3BB|nr:hypothetical protein [Thermomonospora cellulosilytica]